MRLAKFFKKSEQDVKPGRFSGFLLNAPEHKKEEILKKAAHKANGDQREVLIKSRVEKGSA